LQAGPQEKHRLTALRTFVRENHVVPKVLTYRSPAKQLKIFQLLNIVVSRINDHFWLRSLTVKFFRPLSIVVALTANHNGWEFFYSPRHNQASFLLHLRYNQITGCG
jgi:hypothetical protein